MQKIKRLGQLRRTFSLIMVLFITLFLTQFVSAIFTTADYSPDKKTVEVTDFLGLGTKIAKVELTNPLEYNFVEVGKDKIVFEMDIEQYWDEFTNPFGDVKILNLNDGGKEVVKDYKWVYAIYDDVEVSDYNYSCEIVTKGFFPNYDIIKTRNICFNRVVGKHYEKQIVRWEEFTDKTFIKGKIHIGLMTDVNEGDKFDGIPILFEKEISLWVTWEAIVKDNFHGHYTINDGNLGGGGSVGMWVQGNMSDWRLIAFNISDQNNVDSCYAWDPEHQTLYTGVLSSYNCSFQSYAPNFPEFHNMSQVALFANSSVGNQPNQVRDEVAQPISGTNLNTLKAIAGGHLPDFSANYTTNIFTLDTVWSQRKAPGDMDYPLFSNYWDNNATTGTTGYFNVTVANTNGTVYLNFNNTNYTATNNSGDITVFNVTLTGLSIGTVYYNWTSYGNGTDHNFNKSATRDFTRNQIFPKVSLNYPANNTADLDKNVSFNCNASANPILNLSLTINDAVNYTIYNTSGGQTELNLSTSLIFADGRYNWTCEAADESNNLGTKTNYSLRINTVPDINFLTPPTVPDTTTHYSAYIPISLVTNVTFFQNLTINLYKGGTLMDSVFIENDSRYHIFKVVTDGYYYYNATVWTNTTQTNSTLTRGINITNIPEVTLVSPTWINNSNVSIRNLPINVSVNETYFSNMTINVFKNDGANYSIIISNTTRLFNYTISEDGWYSYNVTAWTTTNSHNHTETRYINATAINETFQTYSASTFAGSYETFVVNLTFDSSVYQIKANLSYSGTNYVGTKTGTGDDIQFTKSINIPSTGTAKNNTFYWAFALTKITDSQTLLRNSSQNNQSVAIGYADDCSVYKYLIFNYTVMDEKTQVIYNATYENATVEIDMQLYTQNYSTVIVNYTNIWTFPDNRTFKNITICLKDNPESYRAYSVVKFTGSDYVTENWYTQNLTLRNASVASSTIPQNVNLFHIKSAESTEFLVTYKDKYYAAIPEALININRKYISEGVFKVVEIAKTDKDGRAIVHLDTSGVIYTITLTKNGVVLATFDNIATYCEDRLTGDCQIRLYEVSSGIPSTDWQNFQDLTYDMDWNETSRTVTVNFVTLDGSSPTLTLNATKVDGYKNTTLCSHSVTSSSGTLYCTIPASSGNATFFVELWRTSSPSLLISIWTLAIYGKPLETYGANLFIFIFAMFMTLALLFLPNPIGVVLGTIVAFILGVVLFSLGGTLIGSLSSFVWLLAAAIIIIIRINSKRND